MKSKRAIVVAEAGQGEAVPKAGITPEQEKAMGLMVGGKTIKAAAEEAGVCRGTVHRWMREDPAFIAAWNSWRREQTQVARAQLIGIAGEAVEAVREAVRKGDGKLAMALLKEMGILAAEGPGLEDAESVAKEMELKERKEKAALRRRELGMIAEEV